MAEESRKQDQDKSNKDDVVNPRTCWNASIVDSNCFTICQGNQSVKFTCKKYVKGPYIQCQKLRIEFKYKQLHKATVLKTKICQRQGSENYYQQ